MRLKLIVVLILTILSNSMLYAAESDHQDVNKAAKKTRILFTPGVPIEQASQPDSSKKDESWLSRNKGWVIIGGIILIGAVAAIVSSSGDDSGGKKN
jgi:hypothetical protein